MNIKHVTRREKDEEWDGCYLPRISMRTAFLTEASVKMLAKPIILNTNSLFTSRTKKKKHKIFVKIGSLA